MVYKLHYSKNAVKQLDKMDAGTARLIVKWMDANVNNSINPRCNGKPLKGQLSGYWRYRVGRIRIICQINDMELVVIAINVGKRENVYVDMENC